MKRLAPGIILALLLIGYVVSPAQAGDPDDTIGPVNPNLFFCLDDEGFVVSVDSDASGGAIDSEGTRLSFDETVEVDLDQLKEDCEEAEDALNINLRVDLLRQTDIEGVVYEFYRDPGRSRPGVGVWMGTPARDVLVVATGITFEIFWGSEKDGSYFFRNLGAGPITLNLRLPPDAHPINPNITIMSTSFAETWRVPLGFYRGDEAPGEFDTFILPTGEVLPAANTLFDDVGLDGSLLGGMPNVGGVLPKEGSAALLLVAGLVLLLLPIAGIAKLKR